MSNADDEVLAPAMTKLNVFSLSDEEKAERADMAGKLSEGQYRQWLKERKQAYQEQQAAAQAQAEKQRARGKRAQAQKRTSMKGESLQASRQLYTASWENDAEARRKAYVRTVPQPLRASVREEACRTQRAGFGMHAAWRGAARVQQVSAWRVHVHARRVRFSCSPLRCWDRQRRVRACMHARGAAATCSSPTPNAR